ncbi:hypothetical protein D9M68_553460 [compost metagenome]
MPALAMVPGTACEKKFWPSAPFRSTPSLCCAFTASATDMASRPMAFCVGISVSLRKAMRPPSTPPVKALSSSSTVLPAKPDKATTWRVGSADDVTAAIFEAWSPTTSDWPVAMNTLYLPSSCCSTRTSTTWLSSLTSWSRWSSRSFGAWPPATALIWLICWFRLAILAA